MSRKRNPHDRLVFSQDATDGSEEVMSEDSRRIVSAKREDVKMLKEEFLDRLNMKNNSLSISMPV